MMNLSADKTKGIDLTEIFKRMESNPDYEGYRGSDLKKIRAGYFRKMEESVLNGFEFNISDIGCLCINKNLITGEKRRKRFVKKAERLEKSNQEVNRYPYFYTIDLDAFSGITNFKASKRFRNLLSNILITTSKDFRFK